MCLICGEYYFEAQSQEELYKLNWNSMICFECFKNNGNRQCEFDRNKQKYKLTIKVLI